ncbi:HD-domain/PDEase-like protein, partial [Neocallimastix californiae]
MYMAACIHDFDHPGVSNKFLITVGDPLAELYNDKSVLENHHCSAALKLLNKSGNNFIERLDKEKKRELRETIIELVLATDLSGHFSYLTSFKKKLLDTLTCNTREDKLLLMQMMIKCCDVSNPTKSRNIYKEWMNRVMSEFFSQGDKEKQLNMTVSPFCNRENANKFSCQKGFIDFVAAPIFEAVGEY